MRTFVRERVILNGAERASGMIAEEVDLCEEWLDATSKMEEDVAALPTLWARCIGIQTDLEAAIGQAEHALKIERSRLTNHLTVSTATKDLKQWVIDAQIDLDIGVQALEMKLIGLRADLKYVQKYMAGVELAASLIKVRASAFAREGALLSTSES